MFELKKQKIERQILWSDRLCIPTKKTGTVGSVLLKANPSTFLTRETLVPGGPPPLPAPPAAAAAGASQQQWGQKEWNRRTYAP